MSDFEIVEELMQGFIGKELWDQIDKKFLVLPEDGWAANFIKHVQTEYHWTFETANRFVQWVDHPGSQDSSTPMLDTLEYMKVQAQLFFQKQTQEFESKVVDGFKTKCDDCGAESFFAHDQAQAIDMARTAGWLIRGTGAFGPDSCPACKMKLELAVGRKIRGDGGYA